MEALYIHENVCSDSKPELLEVNDYQVIIRSNIREAKSTNPDGSESNKVLYLYSESVFDKNDYIGYLADPSATNEILNRSTLSDSELINYLKNLFNKSCEAILNKGIILDTTYGRKEFSCKLEDQINLTALHNGIQSNTTLIDYHSNGDRCRTYPINEFAMIIASTTAMIYQQTAYCNLLKSYVESASRTENLNISYGYIPSKEFQTDLIGILKRGLDTMKVTLHSSNDTYNSVIQLIIQKFEDELLPKGGGASDQ